MEENLKILAIVKVIDDQGKLKKQLKSALPDAEFYFESTGIKGIEGALKVYPDIILLDISMQKTENIEVCRQIKAHQNLKDIPVLFLTADDLIADIQMKMSEAGAESFMSLPANDIALQMQIKAMAKIKAANISMRNVKTLWQKDSTSNSDLENHYRILLERTSDFTFSCQKVKDDYEIQWIAGAVEKVTGYTKEQIQKRKCWRFMVHPDDDAVFEKNVISLNPGQESKCELRIIKPSGEINWILTNTICVETNEKGRYIIYGGCINITERKAYETKLQIKDWAIESAITAIVTSEMDGTLNYANPAFLKIWGYDDISEVIGRSAIEFWEMGHKAQEVMNAVLEKGSWSGELTGIRKDGSTFIAQVSTNKVHDRSGNAVCMQASFADISDLKKTDEQLRTSDRIFNHSIDMLCIAGFDGYFKVLNPSWSKILGWSTEELLSKPWNDFVHPDDLMATDKIKSVIIDGQKIYQFENRYICKDGTYKWLSWNSFPYEEEGIMYGVARDVTSQRQTEREYKTLFNEMLDGFALHEMIYDKEGQAVDYRFVSVNPAFEAMTGLKAEDIVGKTLLEVLPDSEDYWIKTYAKVVETGEPIHFENYANELRKFYEVKAFLPAPHKFVTITSDITEKKNAEINLRKSEEKFKSIIDSIPLALHLSTEVEQITEYVNPTMVKMFGYTQEEMPSVAQWWPLAYPDQNYRNFVSNEWNRRVASALETQMPIEPMEVVCTCKDGTKKNILWSFITASGLNYSMGLDITAQKEAEKELHESEERFRALHNASFGGITIHDEGIIIACNQGLSEMTGYSMEELIGMNGLNLISDKALDTVINNIKSGYEKPYESVCVRKDKTEFPVRIEARNIPYQGKMVRVTEFRDITEQKRFESELRDSEERFRLLVKNSSDIILMINEKGLLHYISLAMKAVTGYEPDAFLGKNILDSVHPDDIQSAREVWEKTIKNPDQTVSLQYRHIHKTKGWVYLEAIGQSFLDTPGINAVVVSLRDISHRKQAEMIDLLKFNITRSILNAKNFVDLLEIVRNELGLMFDTTNFFVAMYDAERDMLVNTINKDEKDWFDEWSAKESLSGFVVKSGNSVLMSRKEIEQFSAQNNIELIGAPASCWMGVPIKVENTILGVMAIQSYLDTEAFNKADLALLEMIAHEVGIFIERQNYLDKLLEAKEKAEESDKLKTAFINNISHEIRTPLNGIMGFGQLMAEEDITSEERAVYLKTLQNSSSRLMNTVTDIMDMAFITSGSLELNKQDFLLLPFLTNTVQKMREYSDSKNLELELLESSDAAKIMLNTDKELLGKVLLKLLDNAIKFTDVGKITIGYHFIKDQIEIFVSDTGRGIAADKLNFIFEMFSQEETALTRGYEGSGLGLAIASGIVDKLGGEMKVKSEKGKGSEFSFTIPVKGLKEEDLSTSHPEGRSVNHFRPVILVAEDDESNYMLMEVIVRKTGSEYLHALNGEEAVEMCKQRPDISLVLMDIKMPVLNGIEATKIIRGFRPELPIIATTAFAQTGDETRILKMGFDGYYAKPINPHILKELIEKYG